MNDLRKKLAAKLKELGVTQVSVNYSGYGDSGQIEYVNLNMNVDRGVEFDVTSHPWYPEKQVQRTLDDALTDFLWKLIDTHYSGYENNDGGQGEIEWNVTADTITLDHSWNITTTEHEPTLEL